MQIKKVTVLEIVEKPDGYTDYILEDFDHPHEYLWLSRPINWETPHEVVKGAVGYVKYEEAIAGSTGYFNAREGEFDIYRYNAVYFRGFILETKEKKDEYIL